MPCYHQTYPAIVLTRVICPSSCPFTNKPQNHIARGGGAGERETLGLASPVDSLVVVGLQPHPELHLGTPCPFQRRSQGGRDWQRPS